MAPNKLYNFRTIVIYAFCHFVTDFACATLILGKFATITSDNSMLLYAIITYNFFAFAFQAPLGWFMDKVEWRHGAAILGLALIGVCYLVNANNAFLIAIVAGIGNALFHLEGGVRTYAVSDGKCALNGFFVAPGALGIFLGTTFSDLLINTCWPGILIVVSILMLFSVRSGTVCKTRECKLRPAKGRSHLWAVVILAGASIVVRSIGGSAIDYPWKNTFLLSLCFTIAIVVGKAIGGIIADRFGLVRTVAIALVGAALCLALGRDVPTCGYLGILLFNIPMSITLVLLVRSLPEHVALAVGSNTLFLFVGYVLCLVISMGRSGQLVVSLGAISAAILISVACIIYRRGEKE